MLTKETSIFIIIAIAISVVFSDKKNIRMILPYLKSPATNLIVIAVILLLGFIHIGYGILLAITYLFIYFTDMEMKREAIFNEGFTSKTPAPAPSPSKSKKGYEDLLLESRLKKETDSVKKASINVENYDTEYFDSSNTDLKNDNNNSSQSGNSIEFQTLNLKILTNEANINDNTKQIKSIDDRVKKLEDQVKINTLNIQKVQTTTGNPSDEEMKKLDKGANEVKDVNVGAMIPK